MQIRIGLEQPAAPVQQQAPCHQGQHQHGDAHHDAEREVDDDHRRPVFAREILQALDLAVPAVGQVQAAERGDGDLVAVGLGLRIGNREQRGRRVRARLPQSFHCSQLGGLVLQRVQPVQVADHDLQRHHHRQEEQRHAHHDAALVHEAPAPQVIRAHGQHDEARGHHEGRHGMHQAIRKRGIEDHRQQVGGKVAAIDDLEADWRLHPAVDRQDPERRQHRAERHHHRRQHVGPLRHQLAPEQQYPQEARLQEEGRDHLVAHQGADHVGGGIGKPAPVGAELERHHNARHHAHAERHREDLGPERGQAAEHVVVGDPPAHLERRHEARQAHRERRQQDMQRHHPGKLHARQQQSVECH